MAIVVKPILSEKIYLSDIDQDVAELEGDCPAEERAWVIVRRATEGDSMRLEESLSATEVEYREEVDLHGNAIPISIERRDERLREKFALQVYLCLADAGNILFEDGKEVFSFKDNRVDGTFGEFLKAFTKLPAPVSIAIRNAVYVINKQWDWRLP